LHPDKYLIKIKTFYGMSKSTFRFKGKLDEAAMPAVYKNKPSDIPNLDPGTDLVNYDKDTIKSILAALSYVEGEQDYMFGYASLYMHPEIYYGDEYEDGEQRDYVPDAKGVYVVKRLSSTMSDAVTVLDDNIVNLGSQNYRISFYLWSIDTVVYMDVNVNEEVSDDSGTWASKFRVNVMPSYASVATGFSPMSYGKKVFVSSLMGHTRFVGYEDLDPKEHIEFDSAASISAKEMNAADGSNQSTMEIVEACYVDMFEDLEELLLTMLQ
jgi:hypothetical protein